LRSPLPRLWAALAGAIRRLPGVSAASGSIATSVVVTAEGTNPRSVPARGVDPDTPAGVLDLGVESGSLGALEGNALAVGANSARAFGWHLGDRVSLRLGDGTPSTLRVVAPTRGRSASPTSSSRARSSRAMWMRRWTTLCSSAVRPTRSTASRRRIRR
jgi:hypothetical protein